MTSAEFAVHPDSPCEASRFVADAVEITDDAVFQVELGVSELASNAVLHVKTPFTVTASRSGPVLRIEVTDRSPLQPIPKALGPAAPTGRGLHIVDALANRWGVTPIGEGKAVWFEINDPLPSARTADG